MSRISALLLTASLLLPAFAQSDRDYSQEAAHFDYDRKPALDIQELSVETRGRAVVHDISFASQGGRVPAFLVVPERTGRSAAVVWGHWLMPGSALQNRREFLNEAVALAPAGVVSLLIDAPQNRPGFVEEQDPLGGQRAAMLQQEVIDLRRGLDLLLSRSDVDPQRVAYVGHSLGCAAGSVLDAIDKRFGTFVFMTGPQSVREFVLTSKRPGFAEWRNATPAAAINRYLDIYAWADPASYAPHFGPATALFQYGLQDDWVSVDEANHYLAEVAGPKQVRFYHSGHALNAEARLERFRFLQQRLHLSGVSAETLEQVPPVH